VKDINLNHMIIYKCNLELAILSLKCTVFV